jgi:DNA-binding NtrC family response regulator
VRELKHILQRSLTLARGSVLGPADLSAEVRQGEPQDHGGHLQERLDGMERAMLIAALDGTDWIQTRAADRLGISERVLRYKMGKYGIRRRST